MAILYGKEGTYDLRDLGFDKSLVKGSALGQSDGDIPPDMQSVFAQGLSSALLGSGALGKDLSLGHQTIAAQPTDNLQEIIETLSSVGGGTLKLGAYTYVLDYDIELRSNVNIVGEGQNITILDFNDAAHGITSYGTSSSDLVENFLLRDFTVQNSTNSGGIDMKFSSRFRLQDIDVTGCTASGLRFDLCSHYILSGIRSHHNGTHGFEFIATQNGLHYDFSLLNCVGDLNGQVTSTLSAGFSFRTTDSSDVIRDFTIVNCVAESQYYGFRITSSVVTQVNDHAILIGCRAGFCTSSGFILEAPTISVTAIGCTSNDNSGKGFNIRAGHNRLIGCFSDSNSGVDYDFATRTQAISLIGCDITPGATTSSHAEFSEVDVELSSENNTGGSTRTEKKIRRMRNSSGGNLSDGDVVVLASVAAGDEVTTTATAGDDKVFGCLIDNGGILSTQYGIVLTEGYTKLLKVDGTTDIAVGDHLTTFTTAGIAAKASAGDMVFAIALEAYTTNDSLGVIDALLISPRLI